MPRLSVLALLSLAALLAAGPASAADEACDPLALDLTLTPQRTPNYPSLRETVKLLAVVPERADVVLFGDSLFAGWRTDLPRTFPQTTVYDFAVGGDRVANVLWRIDQVDLAPLAPKLAAVLIGTNDLAAGTPPCAVAAGIDKLVGRLRAMWPDAAVLLLSVPPRGRDFREIDDQRRALNRAIAGIGERVAGVHPLLIDDAAFTCGQYGRPFDRTQPGRLSCAHYVDDNLHFSAKGYAELGRLVAEAAGRVGGDNPFR